MSYVRNVANVVATLLVGLRVTLREWFSRSITLQYPEQRWELPRGYRGHPVLLSDEEGKTKCTACGLCVRACPTDVITVKGAKGEDGKRVATEWVLDMSRCIQCNLCVEACKFDALAMSDRYELACYRREDLLYDMDTLLELGRGDGVAAITVGDKL